jgi:HAD superfamily hydrolase (TIGR01509 family)
MAKTTLVLPPTTQSVFDSHSIRAVLFDAGDILYHRPDKGAGFRAFLDELRLQNGDHVEEKDLLTQQAYRGRIDQDQYREAVLRLYGITEPEQLERGKQILEADDNSVELMEGVPETLLALKRRGYLLGIVTDTANPVHTKLRWFEGGGIGHIWDSIISSREVGTRKPDPQIYRAALEQLGTAPAQVVFVGHKASELAGARQVGMQTIAFNYDPDAEADYFIEDFPELLTLPIIS